MRAVELLDCHEALCVGRIPARQVLRDGFGLPI